jgi:hypothetical protein
VSVGQINPIINRLQVIQSQIAMFLSLVKERSYTKNAAMVKRI